jgi:hypothetical protein
LLFLPWVWQSYTQLLTLQTERIPNQTAQQIQWQALGRVLHYLLLGYVATATLREVVTTVGLVLLGVLGLGLLWRTKRSVALFLLLSVVGGITAVVIVRYTPEEGILRGTRLAFTTLPLLLLLIATGTSHLLTRHPKLSPAPILLLLLSLSLNSFNSYSHIVHQQTDYRPLIAQTAQLARPNDAILYNFSWQQGYFLSYAPALAHALPFYSKLYAEDTTTFVASLLEKHDRVWIINYREDFFAPDNVLGRVLERYGTAVFPTWYGDTQYLLFVRHQPTPNIPPTQATLTYNGTHTTLDYIPLQATHIPGDLLHLHLRWQLAETLQNNGIKLFLHLGKADTPPILQIDAPLAELFPPTNQGDPFTPYILPLPLDIPTGTYQIYAGLYDPQTNNRFTLESPQGCDSDNRICLGTLTITAKP